MRPGRAAMKPGGIVKKVREFSGPREASLVTRGGPSRAHASDTPFLKVRFLASFWAIPSRYEIESE